jgi:hypothetical protein
MAIYQLNSRKSPRKRRRIGRWAMPCARIMMMMNAIDPVTAAPPSLQELTGKKNKTISYSDKCQINNARRSLRAKDNTAVTVTLTATLKGKKSPRSVCNDYIVKLTKEARERLQEAAPFQQSHRATRSVCVHKVFVGHRPQLAVWPWPPLRRKRLRRKPLRHPHGATDIKSAAATTDN